MFAEVQSVPVKLLLWVVLLQHEVHELPVHGAAAGEDQVVAELHTIDNVCVVFFFAVCFFGFYLC